MIQKILLFMLCLASQSLRASAASVAKQLTPQEIAASLSATNHPEYYIFFIDVDAGVKYHPTHPYEDQQRMAKELLVLHNVPDLPENRVALLTALSVRRDHERVKKLYPKAFESPTK